MLNQTVMAELFVNPKFGYLNVEDAELAASNGVYQSLLKSAFKGLRYPETDSLDQLEELTYLQRRMAQAHSDDIKNAQKADAYLPEFIAHQFEGYGRVKVQSVKAVLQAIKPTLMALKEKYNRARPHQLAFYLDQQMHPFKSLTAHNPSFPGGHSCQVRFAALVFSELYPSMTRKLENTQAFVSDSRLILGLHYPSDNEAGFDVADACFESVLTQKFLSQLTTVL